MNKYKITDFKKGDSVYFKVPWQDHQDSYWEVLDINLETNYLFVKCEMGYVTNPIWININYIEDKLP